MNTMSPPPDMEIIVASVRAIPGGETELKEHITALAWATQMEPGCLRFELHQVEGDPAEFVLVEQFRSAADLAFHKTLPHFKSYIERATPLIHNGGAVVRRLKRIA
jgi:quinol monooxygenase YgiN